MLKLPLVKGDYKKIETSIGGTSYTLITKWNSRTESYTLDVQEDQVDLITGIKLFAGVDIFKQYNEISWGKGYVVNSLDYTSDIAYDDLDGDGYVIILEDSDLE